MGGYKKSYLGVASGTLKTGVQDLTGADLTDNPIGKALDFVPYLAIFAVLVGLFIWFLYNKTRHGKYMYAIGGNESAAQVAGAVGFSDYNHFGRLFRRHFGCTPMEVRKE